MRKKAPTHIIKMMVANIDGSNRYVYMDKSDNKSKRGVRKAQSSRSLLFDIGE